MQTATTPLGRSELAQRYFPSMLQKSAWQKLKSWLQVNPRLTHLAHLSRRTFTPAELTLIYAELGSSITGGRFFCYQPADNKRTVPLLWRSLRARRTSLLTPGRSLLFPVRRLLSPAGAFCRQQEPLIRHIYT